MSQITNYAHNRILGCLQGSAGLSAEAELEIKNADEFYYHYFSPTSRKNISDEFDAFCDLATQWKEETRFFSSLTDICMHKCYQRIIGMGPNVLPFIFYELKKEPYHWFWALTVITGEDPIPRQYRGDMIRMAEVWLEWAKTHKFIS